MLRRVWAAWGVALVTSGCAAATSSSAAPPTTICGKTLDSGASGVVVWDATAQSPPPVIDAVSAGNAIFIRVAPDCVRGAEPAWTPTNQARLVDEADAADGRPVVIVLRPASHEAAFSVTARRDGTEEATLRVDLRLGETPQPSSSSTRP